MVKFQRASGEAGATGGGVRLERTIFEFAESEFHGAAGVVTMATGNEDSVDRLRQARKRPDVARVFVVRDGGVIEGVENHAVGGIIGSRPKQFGAIACRRLVGGHRLEAFDEVRATIGAAREAGAILGFAIGAEHRATEIIAEAVAETIGGFRSAKRE